MVMPPLVGLSRGQVLRTIDDLALQDLAEVEALLAQKVPWPRWEANRYYDTKNSPWGGLFATTTPVLNTIYASPIYVPETRAVDQLAIRVGTAGSANSFVRLMLYTPTNGLPDALDLDAGTVTTDVIGLRTIAITKTLPRGLIYAALVAGGTTAPALQSLNVGYAQDPFGSTDMAGAGIGSPSRAIGGTAAPNPFGAITFLTNLFLRVGVRAA